MEDPKNVNVKIPRNDYKDLQKLVEAGKFLSVSDAVRTSIRLLISRYEHGIPVSKVVEKIESETMMDVTS
jgi:Arc/MetJ-type ribon-helix-helix transcriptional regulator